MAVTAIACAQATRSTIGNELVDRVGDVDVSRAEADRRDPGLDDQRRAVMPVLEPSQFARPADGACRAERRRDDRVVERDLGRGDAADQPFDARRVRGEPGVGGRGAEDPVGELPLDERAPAVLVRLARQVLDVAVESAHGRVRDDPFAAGDDGRHAVAR